MRPRATHHHTVAWTRPNSVRHHPKRFSQCKICRAFFWTIVLSLRCEEASLSLRANAIETTLHKLCLYTSALLCAERGGRAQPALSRCALHAPLPRVSLPGTQWGDANAVWDAVLPSEPAPARMFLSRHNRYAGIRFDDEHEKKSTCDC